MQLWPFGVILYILIVSSSALHLISQLINIHLYGQQSVMFWIMSPFREETVHKVPLPDQCRRLPTQLVLIAIGYAHPLTTELLTQLPLQLDARGRVAANDENYQTNVEAVFSCGDMRRGQSLVVWAIREGRQCARAVDLWLRGYSDLPRV